MIVFHTVDGRNAAARRSSFFNGMANLYYAIVLDRHRRHSIAPRTSPCILIHSLAHFSLSPPPSLPFPCRSLVLSLSVSPLFLEWCKLMKIKRILPTHKIKVWMNERNGSRIFRLAINISWNGQQWTEQGTQHRLARSWFQWRRGQRKKQKISFFFSSSYFALRKCRESMYFRMRWRYLVAGNLYAIYAMTSFQNVGIKRTLALYCCRSSCAFCVEVLDNPPWCSVCGECLFPAGNFR